MAAVSINISDEFRGKCNKVTMNNNSLSWITFHVGTNTEKGRARTTTLTQVETLGESDRLSPQEVLTTIRNSIQAKADEGDGIIPPQFILCNIPVVEVDGRSKEVIFFISLCPSTTKPLARFAHASGQASIVQLLDISGKIYQNRTATITSLDELTLEGIGFKGDYDTAK